MPRIKRKDAALLVTIAAGFHSEAAAKAWYEREYPKKGKKS